MEGVGIQGLGLRGSGSQGLDSSNPGLGFRASVAGCCSCSPFMT